MKGEWLLVRMKPRGKERGENWLLRKIEDEHAGSPTGLTDTYLTSVKTGRTMDEIAAGKKDGEGDSCAARRRPGSGAGLRRASTAVPGLRRGTEVSEVPRAAEGHARRLPSPPARPGCTR